MHLVGQGKAPLTLAWCTDVWCPLLLYSQGNKVSPSGYWSFPLLQHACPQSSPYPLVQFDEAVSHLRFVEISQPSFQIAVYLFYALGHRFASRSARKLFDPLFESFLWFWGKDYGCLLITPEGEPKYFAIPWPVTCTFPHIYSEFKSILQILCHTGQNPLPSSFTLYVDVHIICVANKSMASCLKFFIKFV